MARIASVVVTTYNWVPALELVLASLAAQTHAAFEVIVADDGSLSDTTDCVARWQKKFPVALKHCWQEDKGFRASAVRNRAAAMAEGDYLIFLDGDCMVRPRFIEMHHHLAKPGWFVAGNRILCSQEWTAHLLATQEPVFLKTAQQWWPFKMRGEINRFLPLLSLPFGPLRYCQPHRWQGAKTCNLAVWKKDFMAVNGFDEQFQGWGFEDSDLVIRLQNTGVRHKQGRFGVPVIHLWHAERPREQASENWARLLETQRSGRVWAEQGVDQYVHQRLHAAL